MLDVSDLGGERKATPEELAKLFWSVPAERVSEIETPAAADGVRGFVHSGGAGFGQLCATVAYRLVEIVRP